MRVEDTHEVALILAGGLVAAAFVVVCGGYAIVCRILEGETFVDRLFPTLFRPKERPPVVAESVEQPSSQDESSSP